MGQGTSTRLALAVLILAGSIAGLSGCGRKNLPVPPKTVTSEIGKDDPNDNQPASVGNFQRVERLSSYNDLTVTPAQVSRNPKAKTKSFLLDGLLN